MHPIGQQQMCRDQSLDIGKLSAMPNCVNRDVEVGIQNQYGYSSWGAAVFQMTRYRVIQDEQAIPPYRERPDWDQPNPDWSPEGLGKKSKGIEKQSIEEYFSKDQLWELRRVAVPEGLRRIVGALDRPFLVDRHVLEEAVPGGKHEEIRWHVEHLEQVIAHWSLWGDSPSRKIEQDVARWEVYTRIGDEYWILTVLGTRGPEEPYSIVTIYPAKTQTVANRMEGNDALGIKAYLQRREP